MADDEEEQEGVNEEGEESEENGEGENQQEDEEGEEGGQEEGGSPAEEVFWRTPLGKKVALKKFYSMEGKYDVRSFIWPFLTTNEKDTCAKIKKILPSQYAKFKVKVEGKQKSFWAKVKSLLSAIVPILPYIIIGLLVLCAIVGVIGAIMPWLTGSFSGTNGSPFGVNGENFYGMRYIYRDEEQAQADLWADYASALSYTIENFDDENITLELKMPTVEGGTELDLSKLTNSAENAEFADEYNLAVELAKAVYLADNAGVENADSLALEELLAGIKYFGLDADIVEKISANWAQYIEEHEALYTLKSTDEGDDGTSSSVDVSDTLTPKFNELLLEEFVTGLQTADGAPTRTDLLYVKDYILGDDAESTLDGIGQEDYVAMIYLPKNAVSISSVTYSIYGVESENFNVGVYLNGTETTAKNDSNFSVFIAKSEVDSEFDNYQFLAENLTLSAVNFTDFQKEFLTTEKSLFNILRALKRDNGGANSALLGGYLTEADANNTAFWANDAGAGDEGAEGEPTAKYYTFNYQTYLAVLMQNSAGTAYSFTEYETNVG